MLPNIWTQGQLFAFSALDGESHIEDDLPGILCGDKLGIRFFTKVKRELVITGIKGFVPTFETVTGDVIVVETNAEPMHILFAQRHLVIGNTAAGADVVVLTEGEHTLSKNGNITIQDTGDGDFTALYKDGNRFAFAYGHAPEEVTRLAMAGIQLSVQQIKERNLALYRQFYLPSENPYARLYGKCISVMKTQLYSPEGQFQRIWSTPDRLPHKRLWLWDSVFHAIGHRNLHPEIAEGLILAVLDTQTEDGFIPHMAAPEKISAIIQPPVIAWGAWKVYEKSGNKDFLRKIFLGNKAFLLWCRENRRESQAERYTWKTTNIVTCRCDECGMDNSPRFDLVTRLEAIDFTCFMANDVRAMAKIAEELGEADQVAFFKEWYGQLRAAVNEKLWDEADGFYYDYDMQNERLHKVASVASFLPLFAGVCDETQAAALVAQLQDSERFGAPFPVPSISKKDPTYGTDMWRGAVWINYNYMIAEGLEAYGYTDLAEEIRDKTVENLNTWYLKKGTLFEFYDSENRCAPNEMNRKGPVYEPYDFTVRMQSIRDYGWSNTLCLDLLHINYTKKERLTQ